MNCKLMQYRNNRWTIELNCYISDYQFYLVYDRFLTGMFDDKWIYDPFSFEVNRNILTSLESNPVANNVISYIKSLDKF
jgi:hypothetical protein